MISIKIENSQGEKILRVDIGSHYKPFKLKDIENLTKDIEDFINKYYEK